jgi:hypothetical protein
MAFLMLLRRMELDDLTVHGFRATFKTWARERTSFQNEIVEAALAHVVGDKVEQAYRRGDLFEKRRRLMQQWATFCASAPTSSNGVVPCALPDNIPEHAVSAPRAAVTDLRSASGGAL